MLTGEGSAQPLPRHIPGLDALRAIAAVMVVVCHATRAATTWNPTWAAAYPSLAGQIGSLMGLLGAWGVGMFFVLSGLCIHLPQARRLADGESVQLSLGEYFRRRFWRIYPPHLLALVASIAVAWLLGDLIAAYGIHPMVSFPSLKQLLLHLFLLHSFAPSAFNSINHVFWSIAVEFHFYLLYPLLLVGRRRTSMVKLCVVLLGVSLAVRVGAHGLSPEVKAILDRNFTCRFWEWVLGCAVAEWLCRHGAPSRSSLPTVVAACAGSFAFGIVASRLPYGALIYGTVWPVLFGGLIILGCGLALSKEGRFAQLGHRSYSLYLTHPVALTIALVIARSLGLPFWGEWLIAVPCITAVMLAFFRFAERPFLRVPSRKTSLSPANG
jgi:peptidoglycan/LPS O-acetylase OafA/YrhL